MSDILVERTFMVNYEISNLRPNYSYRLGHRWTKAFLRLVLEEEYLIISGALVSTNLFRRSSLKTIKKVSGIKIHPKYIQKIRNQNDIALIRIAKKFDFSDRKKISPICLPSNYKWWSCSCGHPTSDPSTKDTGLTGYAAGWGFLYEQDKSEEGLI